MLFWAILFFIIAIIVVVADIFVEGFGIFGAFGVLLLVGSMYMTYYFVPDGPYIVIAKGFLTLLIFSGVVSFAKKKKIFQKLALNETLAEAEPAVDVRQFVGQVGRTVTALRPTGHVEFDGVLVEARTESAYILADEAVVGAYVRDHTLFVKVVEK